MKTPDFEQARLYAANRLEQELSPNLLYHGVTHTREDVVPAVELLARMEGIPAESLTLLLTAAWFHDLGFVEQPAYHEVIGARIAAQVLPGFGYTEAQVEVVRWAIFATIIPQAPKNILEEIMADADLNVLGQTYFWRRNGDLRRELAFFGKTYSDVDWFTGQLKFVENHIFFTASARALWRAQEEENLAALRNALAALSSPEI